MNKDRRKRIEKVKIQLSKIDSFDFALSELESILFEEEDAFYSTPDNLQYSERGIESQEAIEYLTNAINIVSDYLDNEYLYDEYNFYDDEEDEDIDDNDSFFAAFDASVEAIGVLDMIC